MSEAKRNIAVVIITLIGITLLVSVIFLAPYLKSRGIRANVFLYGFTGSICHQVPDRCIHMWNHPLAVCSRCMGIYAGFLAGTLVYPFFHGFTHTRLPHIETMILMTIPIGIDALGNFFHFWDSAGWLRFTVGFFWGILLPYYFIPGIVDAVRLLHSRR